MKFKTLKLSQKIRLTVNGTSQCMTIKQAMEQFLDGGIVESFIRLFDDERAKYTDKSFRCESLGTRHKDVNLQIDLY